MTNSVYKRYSESFRIHVVREYEQSGKSVNALRQKYGVGHKTLKRWIQHYSKSGVRYNLMRIQTPKEQNKLKTLEKENARLKTLVANLTLENAVLEGTLSVIKQDYGIDTEKNVRQSLKRRRQPIQK